MGDARRASQETGSRQRRQRYDLTAAGDAREVEQATRVGLAVRHALARGGEVPAELQAAFERAEQALYANVRDLFGGRLRQAVTGAAPIAPDILEFFYACGVPVMEGVRRRLCASVCSRTVSTPITIMCTVPSFG